MFFVCLHVILVPVSSLVLGMCNQSNTQFWLCFFTGGTWGHHLEVLCAHVCSTELAEGDFASQSISSDTVTACQW